MCDDRCESRIWGVITILALFIVLLMAWDQVRAQSLELPPTVEMWDEGPRLTDYGCSVYSAFTYSMAWYRDQGMPLRNAQSWLAEFKPGQAFGGMKEFLDLELVFIWGQSSIKPDQLRKNAAALCRAREGKTWTFRLGA